MNPELQKSLQVTVLPSTLDGYMLVILLIMVAAGLLGGVANQICQFGNPLGQGQDRKDGDLGNKLHDGTGIRLEESEPNLVEHRITG